LLGLAVIFWPRETLRVVAVLFAVQLIAASAFRFVVAVINTGDSIVYKVQLAALASFALVVGIFLLEDTRLSLRLMSTVLGVYWAVHGAIELVEAIRYSGRTNRTWVAVSGMMGLGVGMILIVAGMFPVDLQAFQNLFLLTTRTLGLWLILFGVILVIRAMRAAAPHPTAGATSGTAVG
jgi:uncharacterized membrane protein HdeD (DUF308 family)